MMNEPKLTAAVMAVALACGAVYHCGVVAELNERIAILEWDLEMSRQHTADVVADETRRMAIYLRTGENRR